MNLPNILTSIRLCLIPVFTTVFFLPIPAAHPLAAAIYAAAFFTDIADGYIARKYDLITTLGKVLDPLADKLFTFTVIICVTIDGVISLWAVVVFFCKEALMALGGLVFYRRERDMISSNWWGKLSTGVFFIVLMLLMLFPAIPSVWATAMISFALALTLAALCNYAWCFLRITKLDKK